MNILSKRSMSLLVSFTALVLTLSISLSAYAAPLADKAQVIRAAYVGTVSQSMFMANLEFPADTKLPVDIDVAVPRGAVINWFGEIMGADPSQDKALTYKKTETRGDFDIYRTTLANSRIVQVEAGVGMPIKENEGKTTLTVTYAPAQNADELILAAELPNTAEVELVDGVSPIAEGSAGGQVYGATRANVKAGQESSAVMTYKIVSTTQKTVNDTLSGKLPVQTVILIVMGIAAVALIVGIVVVSSSKKSNGSDDSENDDDDEFYNGESDEDSDDSAGEFYYDDEEDIEEEATPAQEFVAKSKKNTKATAPAVAKEKMNTKQKLMAITVALVVLGAGAIAAAGFFTDRPTQSNGVYSQVFAQGDPCAEVKFPLTEEALSNTDNAAASLFSVLKKSSVPVLKGNLDTAGKMLTVGYCESKTTAQDIERLLEGSTLVGKSDVAPRNTVLASGDGTVYSYNFTETAPCVVVEVAFETAPSEDPVAATQALAAAVANVPSMATFNYYAATKTAQFGFCDEQANDDAIIAALSAAGIKAAIKTPSQAPAPAQQ